MFIHYLLSEGIPIPETIHGQLHTNQLEELLIIHRELTEMVRPATPDSIRYLMEMHKQRKAGDVRSVPLVGKFIVLAVIAMLVLIGTGLSEQVSHDNLAKGILVNHGLPLLLNLMFLSSAAAIGALFFMLSKLTTELKKATFHPMDSSNYWVRLIMGILSGLILSEMIVLNQSATEATIELNRLMFALLGGFSSEVVFRILETVIQKIHAFFQ